MGSACSWVAPSIEKPALAGAGFSKAYQIGNKGEGSGCRACDQAAHRSRAAEYWQAARRNFDAGRELGGRQGFALMALSRHFDRRAHIHAVAAGGVR